MEYLFPLPHAAAVTDYHIQIGSRTITVQIKEAEAARKTYQKAVEEGKHLLDHQGKHASITYRDGKLILLDLNSPSGTFLNGRKLSSTRPAMLRAGDEIRVGRCVLDVEFQSP